MNLHIQFNERVIERVKSQGISTENMGSALFVLFALYEQRIDLLDLFDDTNKEKRALILYQTLERKGLIEKTDETEQEHYRLSEKGIDLINFVKAQFTQDTGVTTQTLMPALSTENVSAWIKKYIDLFPAEKVGGRYLRTNITECTDRMRWFIKTYPYTMDIILKATEDYLSSQALSKDGHMYTVNSSYFIFKGRNRHERTSGLATWCERVGDSEPISDISSKLV